MIAKRKSHLLQPHALQHNTHSLQLSQFISMTSTCIQFHCKASNFLVPSHFLGSSSFLQSPQPNPPLRNRNPKSYTQRRISNRNIRGGVVCGVLFPVDPWAPNIDSQSIASQLFAASLFPYLGFLYFITKSKTAPKLTLFGFYFLLAFVGATIPAGIYAKVNYGTSLANVDWLHGGAESLLTLTNIFIVLGLREALRKAKANEGTSDPVPGLKEESKTSV